MCDNKRAAERWSEHYQCAFVANLERDKIMVIFDFLGMKDKREGANR